MNHPGRTTVIIAAIYLALALPAGAVNFINNCDGQSPSAAGTWFGTCPPFDNSQTNWEGNVIPGPTDNCFLAEQYGPVEINGYASEATVMSVQAMGGLVVDYAPYGLILTSGSSLINGLQMGPGQITAQQGVTITLTGSSQLWANYYGPGPMTNTGTLTLNGALLWNGARLNNDGAATHSSGIIQLGDGNTALVNNGSLEISGSAGSLRGGGSTLANNGSIAFYGSGGTYPISPNYIQNGTLLVFSGTLQLNSLETTFASGDVTVQSGATLLLQSNAGGDQSHLFNGLPAMGGNGLVDSYQTYTVSSPLTLAVGSGDPDSGIGGFRNQGNLVCDAVVSNSGRFRFNSGQISGAGGFINLASGWTYTRTSGGATINTDFRNEGNFQLGGGSMSLPDEPTSFQNFATFIIKGGNISGLGQLNNSLDLRVELANPAATTSIGCPFIAWPTSIQRATSGTLNFTGALENLIGGALRWGQWICSEQGRIIFPETVTSLFQGAKIIGPRSSFPNVNLNTVSEGSELKSKDWDNLGDLLLDDGDLTVEAGGNGISGPGTLTNTEGGTIGVEEGADLDVGQLDNGDGFDSVVPELASITVIAKSAGEKTLGQPATVTAPVINNHGRIAPGQREGIGTLHLVGHLTQHAAGDLDFDLAGTVADSLHDQLTIDGDATLGGELTVRLQPDYWPAVGQEFTVLSTTGSITGSIAVINQPAGATFSLRQESQRLVLVADQVTGVSPVPQPATGFQLAAAYPNPFNPSTTLSFDLPRELPVQLRIYDVSGRLVRELLRGETRPAGHGQVNWDGRNVAGSAAPAGVYFYKIQAGEFAATRRMTLIK
jgi:hypothetical protein